MTYEDELEIGKTYYIAEVDASGAPVDGSDGTPFYGDESESSIEINFKNQPGTNDTVSFENWYDTLSDDFYFEGKLRITKKFVDDKGEPIKGNYTFYAGIFVLDEDDAYVLADAPELVSSNVVALHVVDGVSDVQEVTVHLTGETPEEAEQQFFVWETDAEGNMLDVEYDENESPLSSGSINGMHFTVTATDDGLATVMPGKAGKITITNSGEQVDIPDNYYFEGELDITKKVLTGTGVETRSDATFYAGIFLDENFKTLAPVTGSTPIVSTNVIELKMNNTSSAIGRVKVFLRGKDPSVAKQTLYVTETDRNGVPVNRNGFTQNGITYRVEVSNMKTEVVPLGQGTVSKVTIRNQQITPTPTVRATGSGSTGSSGSIGSTTGSSSSGTVTSHTSDGTKQSVTANTGDDTQIALYVGILAIAALAIFFVTLNSRKRKEEDN